MTSRDWRRLIRLASNRSSLTRAALTAVVVGALLIAVGHGSQLLRGSLDPALAWQAPLTFAIPFAVSVLSSVATLRRRDPAALDRSGADLMEAMDKFPDQNPNPVGRMSSDGVLLYANPASAPILESLGLEVGGRLSQDQMRSLGFPISESAGPPWIKAGKRTFRVLSVPVPDLGVINLYATDITAERVVERFPDQNPNPVLRFSDDGRLIYANAASGTLLDSLRLTVGEPLPQALKGQIVGAQVSGTAAQVEAGNRIYSFKAVPVEEFAFTTIYGTDVTATVAMNKFPDQNPNPVLRINPEGVLIYANAASAPVVAALGAPIGELLPAVLLARVHTLLSGGGAAMLEVAGEGRIFELLVVSNYEFGFITLYGTDVTAARQIDDALVENERLLLNILPASIVERLKRGETPIADRFDSISVLFADVVKFTELAALLEPTKVVEVLNGVFSIFDELVDRYGLEKIKTIGDAYMVAGGLLGEQDHAERMADLGLEMMTALQGFREDTGHQIEVRAGMHSGPGAAGVVGVKKFVYDVWGDTVNTASRMESQGAPGRVQVSESTYLKLRHRFEFEPRGHLQIKGKGDLMTYFLIGRRPASP